MPGYNAAYGGVGPSPVKPTAPRAIVGFILSVAAGGLSLISFFTLGILTFPLAIAGIIVSHLGLKDTKNTELRGRGLALEGVIVGYVTAAVVLLVLALFLFAVIFGATHGDCTSSGAGQASCSYGTQSSFGTNV
jgi:hypothetical protein